MFRGSIVAIVTPFTPSLKVDFAALRELAEWHIQEGTDAIVCCGSTGEASTLTHEEQKEVTKTVVDVVKGRIPVIAGTGTNDTRMTVLKTREAQECGADGCLVIVPYYNRPTPEGCLIHFQEVAKIGLPMIVYHHPGRTGIKLSPKFLAQISKIPQVVCIKDSTGDVEYLMDFMRLTSTPLLSGDDTLTLPLISIGAVGVISIVANLIPRQWKEFVNAISAGDLLKARQLNDRLYPLAKSMCLEVNPQCVKYAMGVQGKCQPLLRLPLIEPQESTKQLLRSELEQLELAASL